MAALVASFVLGASLLVKFAIEWRHLSHQLVSNRPLSLPCLQMLMSHIFQVS